MGTCPVLCLTAAITTHSGAPNGQGTISSTRLLLAHRTYSYHRAIASGQDPSIRPVRLQFLLLPASTNDPFSSLNSELRSIHLPQLHNTGLGNDFMDTPQQSASARPSRGPAPSGWTSSQPCGSFQGTSRRCWKPPAGNRRWKPPAGEARAPAPCE